MSATSRRQLSIAAVASDDREALDYCLFPLPARRRTSHAASGLTIADALVAGGAEVKHILESGTTPHTLTCFAVVQDGRVSYPADSPEDRPQPDLFAR